MVKLENFLSMLVPSFLLRWDRYLLLHNRLLWTSKLHYVLFYVFVAGLVGLGFGFAYPMSAAYLPEVKIFALLFFFLSFIPLSLWLKAQLEYSVEVNFGKIFPFFGYFRYLLQIISVGLIFGVALFSAQLLNWRVANVVHDEELYHDINVLNLGNPYFPTHEYGDNFFRGEEFDATFFTPYFNDFPKEKIFDDSHLKQYTRTSQSHSNEIYGKIHAYLEVFAKYGGKINADVDDIYTHFQTFTRQKYTCGTNPLWLQKQIVKDNIRSIVRAKAGANLPFHKGTFVTFLLLMPFVFVLMLQVIQDLGWRVGFLTCLSGTLILVAASFLSILFEYSFSDLGTRSGTMFFALNIGAYFFVSMQTLGIFNLRRYSLVRAVCLALSMLSTPFVLAWLSVLFYKLHIGYIFHYNLVPEIWVGIGFFFVLALPIFRFLSLKLHALPR